MQTTPSGGDHVGYINCLRNQHSQSLVYQIRQKAITVKTTLAPTGRTLQRSMGNVEKISTEIYYTSRQATQGAREMDPTEQFSHFPSVHHTN
jgi:hypothetical protein